MNPQPLDHEFCTLSTVPQSTFNSSTFTPGQSDAFEVPCLWKQVGVGLAHMASCIPGHCHKLLLYFISCFTCCCWIYYLHTQELQEVPRELPVLIKLYYYIDGRGRLLFKPTTNLLFSCTTIHYETITLPVAYNVNCLSYLCHLHRCQSALQRLTD